MVKKSLKPKISLKFLSEKFVVYLFIHLLIIIIFLFNEGIGFISENSPVNAFLGSYNASIKLLHTISKLTEGFNGAWGMPI